MITCPLNSCWVDKQIEQLFTHPLTSPSVFCARILFFPVTPFEHSLGSSMPLYYQGQILLVAWACSKIHSHCTQRAIFQLQRQEADHVSRHAQLRNGTTDPNPSKGIQGDVCNGASGKGLTNSLIERGVWRKILFLLFPEAFIAIRRGDSFTVCAPDQKASMAPTCQENKT